MADKDVDAFRKIRSVKYNNNIEKYVTRLKHLNRKVELNLGSLKELVRPNLPEWVQMSLPMYGKTETTKAFWIVVLAACRAHEDALYARKGQNKTSSASVNASTKVETGNTSRAKEGSAPAQTKPKTHNGAKPEKAKADRDTITAPKRDSNTRVSKPKREYPQAFDSFEKAQEGVPANLVRERRTAGVCTRYGKPNHNAKFCTGRANMEQAIVSPYRALKNEAGSAAVGIDPTSVRPPRRRARTIPAPGPGPRDVGDLDSDMD